MRSACEIDACGSTHRSVIWGGRQSQALFTMVLENVPSGYFLKYHPWDPDATTGAGERGIAMPVSENIASQVSNRRPNEKLDII